MSVNKKSAFVLGASGEVGMEVVKELIANDQFSKIVIIGRRELKEDLYKNLEQRIVDFDKIEDHAAEFKDLDCGFCCLGTTRAKNGAAHFFKVDHDYVVNSAKVAFLSGCRNFSVVSSTGANAKSSFLYSQTKGKMEEALQNIGFDKLSIYRPAMLVCNRRESRPLERLIGVLIIPLNLIFPTRVTIKTVDLAKVMVKKALEPPTTEKVEIIYNPDLYKYMKTIEETSQPSQEATAAGAAAAAAN